MAATAGNGNFGTLPIYGQLSDKPQLANIYLCWGIAGKAMADRKKINWLPPGHAAPGG
jgi:hypothetical protein